MKKTGVMQHRLSAVIAEMGHTDLLVIGDAGLPVPPGVERIDLAVVPGLPPMLEVTRAVAGELQVEHLIVATELRERNLALIDQLTALFPDATLEIVPHVEFKERSTRARAVVRTAECTPYANVILQSGVTY